MAQIENNVNRVSGSHLIADENHMGEIIARLQNGQATSQVEQSRTYQQQQGGSDRIANRQSDNRTRQSY